MVLPNCYMICMKICVFEQNSFKVFYSSCIPLDACEDMPTDYEAPCMPIYLSQRFGLKKCKTTSNFQVQYIQMQSYPIETHYVTTSDNYILTVHRIPRRRSGTSNGKVAILLHGFGASSSQWVYAGHDRGLGKHSEIFSLSLVLVVYFSIDFLFGNVVSCLPIQCYHFF